MRYTYKEEWFVKGFLSGLLVGVLPTLIIAVIIL